MNMGTAIKKCIGQVIENGEHGPTAQKNLSQYRGIIHFNRKENLTHARPRTLGRDCRICRDRSFRDGASMFKKVEEPDYTVLESLENNVEIREYRPQIWTAIAKGNENGAFGTQAGYIVGDNSRKERIFLRRNEVALLVKR